MERSAPSRSISETGKPADPSVVVHFRRLREVVGEQVEKLPEKERVVISLYYWSI